MFEVEILTGNAAFENPHTGEEDLEYEAEELCKILDKIKESLKKGDTKGIVLDTNGNKVGRWIR